MDQVLLMIACCLSLLLAAGCDRVPSLSAPPVMAEPAPELNGGLTWINSRPLRLAELRGKVVLVDFFEYSCVNCLRTLPYLRTWQQRYQDKGLVIIGIHTPQYGFSMDPQNVYAAVNRLDLTYPVVVDSEFALADAYRNRFWPRKFLVDTEGRIRFDHTGEGAYAATEQMIQDLLREMQPDLDLPPLMQPLRAVDRDGAVCYPTTPELYLGQLRGELGNRASAVATNDSWQYTMPAEPEPDVLYVHGEWEEHSEYLRHTRDTEELEDFLFLRYHATEVNVVMKPEDRYWMQIFIKQDGDWIPRQAAGQDIVYDEEGRSYIKVDSPRMYNLAVNQAYGVHDLEIYAQGKGLSVYSLSFGTSVIPAGVDRLKPLKETP